MSGWASPFIIFDIENWRDVFHVILNHAGKNSEGVESVERFVLVEGKRRLR